MRAGKVPKSGELVHGHGHRFGRYRLRGSEFALRIFSNIVIRGYLIDDATRPSVDGYLLQRFVEDNPKSVGRRYGDLPATLPGTMTTLAERGLLLPLEAARPHAVFYRPALADWTGFEWRDRVDASRVTPRKR